MSIRKSLKLPVTEIAIMAAIEAIAKEQIADIGEEVESTALDWYGESYMESLSEAGYTETRPNDRLSIRAFARLVRVQPAELGQLKDLLGFRRGSVYRDFAVCDNVLTALGRNAELAPALALLNPGETKSEGPFYPDATTFDIAEVLRARPDHAEYLKAQIEAHKNAATTLTDVDNAVLKLAGAFNVSGLTRTAKDLATAGATNDQALKVTLAYVVLDTLRTTPRFAAGLRSAQPSAPKSE